MRKKRSLLLTLVLALCLCTAAVCGVAFADDGTGSEPATPTAEDWSADETKWTTDGYAFDETLGMHLTKGTPGTYATTEKSIGGNSKITLEIEGNLPDETPWYYEWIVIKNTNDTALTALNKDATISVGNWIAIYFGKGVNFYVMECKNGAITSQQCALHCADAWVSYKQKQTITIETKDTDIGVEISMRYEGPNENTTYKHISDNKMLWGDYSLSLGRGGDGAGSPINLETTPKQTITYKVDVTNVHSDKEPLDTTPELDPDNLAQDIENWSQEGKVGTDVTVDAFGVKFGGNSDTYGRMLDKNVAVNSTLTISTQGKSPNTWGNMFIMFKNMENYPDSIAPNRIAANTTEDTGTWMALKFGNNYFAAIIECVDGVVTQTGIRGDGANQIPGGDVDHPYQQITNITLKTEDLTETKQVKVTITLNANNCTSGDTTGATHTVEYTTKDTTGAFLGDYAFSIGAYYGHTGPILLTSLKTDKPLVKRVVNDGLCEFATDLKYWKNITPANNVFIDEDGLQVWNTQFAEAMLNQRVEAGKTVSLTVDGDMDNAPWGNMYFILNFDAPEFMMKDNSPVPAPKGNRMAIMAGGNGFRAYVSNGGEWESGEEEITGENIANTGKDLGAGVTSTDFWYIYKQYTKFTFTLNVDEAEDEVSLTITLLGASGTLQTVECRTGYTADDVADGFYFGVACYLGSVCDGANGSVRIPTIKIQDVAEGFVKEWNVEETQRAILAASQTTVTAANKAELQAKVAAWKALQAELNYEDGTTKFPYELLATVENNIKAYEEDETAANNVKTLIAAIPASITASNKADAESKVSAAETAYAALSAAAKAMVGDTEAAKITAARAAITAIEDRAAADAVLALIGAIPASITADNKADAESKVAAAETAYAALNAAAKAMVGDTEAAKITSARAAITALNDSQSGGDNQGGDNQGGEEEDKGCGSNAAATLPIAALALLGAAGVMIASKKRRA